jgi:predicted acylesterase/phospholipase RssA
MINLLLAIFILAGVAHLAGGYVFTMPSKLRQLPKSLTLSPTNTALQHQMKPECTKRHRICRRLHGSKPDSDGVTESSIDDANSTSTLHSQGESSESGVNPVRRLFNRARETLAHLIDPVIDADSNQDDVQHTETAVVKATNTDDEEKLIREGPGPGSDSSQNKDIIRDVENQEDTRHTSQTPHLQETNREEGNDVASERVKPRLTNFEGHDKPTTSIDIQVTPGESTNSSESDSMHVGGLTGPLRSLYRSMKRYVLEYNTFRHDKLNLAQERNDNATDLYTAQFITLLQTATDSILSSALAVHSPHDCYEFLQSVGIEPVVAAVCDSVRPARNTHHTAEVTSDSAHKVRQNRVRAVLALALLLRYDNLYQQLTARTLSTAPTSSVDGLALAERIAGSIELLDALTGMMAKQVADIAEESSPAAILQEGNATDRNVSSSRNIMTKLIGGVTALMPSAGKLSSSASTTSSTSDSNLMLNRTMVPESSLASPVSTEDLFCHVESWAALKLLHELARSNHRAAKLLRAHIGIVGAVRAFSDSDPGKCRCCRTSIIEAVSDFVIGKDNHSTTCGVIDPHNIEGNFKEMLMDVVTTEKKLVRTNTEPLTKHGLARVTKWAIGDGANCLTESSTKSSSASSPSMSSVPKWRPKIQGQRGLRILTLDGGGTKGVLSLSMLAELLRQLHLNKDAEGDRDALESRFYPHQHFDYICGTSTGGIIAAMFVLSRLSLDQAQDTYGKFVHRVFSKRSNIIKALSNKAFYCEKEFEMLLDTLLGNENELLIDCNRHNDCPRLGLVSTNILRQTPTAHLWRNYDIDYAYDAISDSISERPSGGRMGRLRSKLPPFHQLPSSAQSQGEVQIPLVSRYRGSCRIPSKDAIRATTAAPMFFTPVVYDNEVFCDGALVANNPAAIAVQEAKVRSTGCVG